MTVAATLVIWEVIGRRGGEHGALPPFSDTLASLIQSLQTATLWTAISDTLVQWATGLALAAAVAIPLGLLIGTGEGRIRVTRSTIDFLRTIPPVMLLPLFVLVWGTGLKMVVLLALYAAVWPMLTQTISGVRNIDPATFDTVRIFRIGRRRRFWKVLIPAVSPFIASGVRISAVISLFIAIVCELLAGTPGIGNLLVQRQLIGDTAGMWAMILLTGILGLTINAGFRFSESHLLRWHPAYAKEG